MGLAVPAGGDVRDSSGDLYIGHSTLGRSATPNRLNGLLDDIRIYDRALSETEIQELYGEPTLIQLADFTAASKSDGILLEWLTESEIDNAGFNIYRAETKDGKYIKINDSLIPAEGSTTEGAYYEFIDETVKNRRTYYYKLEDIDFNGMATTHGPVSATPRLLFRK